MGRLTLAEFESLLEQHHVTFNERDVYDPNATPKRSLPNQVEYTLGQLMRLERIVPGTWPNDGDGYMRQHWSAFVRDYPKAKHPTLYFHSVRMASRRDSRLNQEEIQLKDRKLQKNFKIAMTLVDEATRIAGWNSIDEGRYHEILNTYLFRDWVTMATTNPHGHDMQNDSIACFQDWVTFKDSFVVKLDEEPGRDTGQAPVKKSKKKLTRPKPDWAFAFPIYLEPGVHANGPYIHDETSIFSLINLAYLEELGIVASPTTNLVPYLRKLGRQLLGGSKGSQDPNSITTPDARLHCYPWAIIELKRPGVKDPQITYAYCQAANTCSACLTMLEKLADDTKDPVPPIVAMTFIGPISRVWLTYAEECQGADWTRREMICIWEGNLTNPLDAVQLVRIKELILEWARGYFKPWVRSRLQNRYRELFLEEQEHKNEPGARSLSALSFDKRRTLQAGGTNFWTTKRRELKFISRSLVGEWYRREPPRISPLRTRSENAKWKATDPRSSPTPLGRHAAARSRSFSQPAIGEPDAASSNPPHSFKENDSALNLANRFQSCTLSDSTDVLKRDASLDGSGNHNKNQTKKDEVPTGTKVERRDFNEDQSSSTEQSGTTHANESQQITPHHDKPSLFFIPGTPLPKQKPKDQDPTSGTDDTRDLAPGEPSTPHKQPSRPNYETPFKNDIAGSRSAECSRKSQSNATAKAAGERHEPLEEPTNSPHPFRNGYQEKAGLGFWGAKFPLANQPGKLTTGIEPQSGTENVPGIRSDEVVSDNSMRESDSESIASESDSEDAVSESGSDLSPVSPRPSVRLRYSRLHHAVARGDLAAVTGYLVWHGAYVDSKDESGWTPLHIAVQERRLRIAEFLMRKGAHINERTDEGMTPFHLAIAAWDLGMAKFLLQHGADINRRTNGDGWTALDFAVKHKEFKWAHFLIHNGADVNRRNRDRSTPLHSAADIGSLRMAEMLVDAGADVGPKDKCGWSPILEATEKGGLILVKYLVTKGADIEIIDKAGWRPVHAAAEHNRLEVLKFLIAQGAAIDSRNRKRWTPLHSAAERGNLEIVEYLVEEGANVDAETYDGWTPLLLAALADELETVQFLFPRANIQGTRTQGWTPLHVAAQQGHKEIVSYLFEEGADLDAQTDEGWTALHLAAEGGHLETVVYLCDEEANLDVEGLDGRTALDLARQNNNDDVVEYIEDELSKGWLFGSEN